MAAAAQRGLDRLEDVQGGSGGFVSDDGAVNANTTGVAAQALTAGGRTAAADAAVDVHHDPPVRRLQPAGPARRHRLLGGDTRSTTVPTDTDLRATPQARSPWPAAPCVDTARTGVERAAPGPQCPPAATREPIVVVTRRPPSRASTPTSTGAPTEAAGGSDPSTTVDASSTGALAQTGTDLLLPALLGLALVVIGGVAVFASTRRRGAHA